MTKKTAMTTRVTTRWTRILTAGALVFGVANCGSEDGDTTTSTVSVADGTYAISGPTCSSSDAAPQYASVELPLAYRDFSSVSERTITISGLDYVEAVVGAGVDASGSSVTCTLTTTGRLVSNGSGRLVMSTQRTHTFTPTGCMLNLTLTSGGGSATVPIGKETESADGSTAFADTSSDAADSQATFTLTERTNGYSLVTPELFSDICPDASTAVLTWTRSS